MTSVQLLKVMGMRSRTTVGTKTNPYVHPMMDLQRDRRCHHRRHVYERFR